MDRGQLEKQYLSISKDHNYDRSALSMTGGDISKYDKQLKTCMEAILPCYIGQHDLCKKNSLVCRGKYSFPYLSKSLRYRINLNYLDRNKLKGELLKRLTPEMLKNTCKLQSTQKAESLNSAFRVTIKPPKHCNIFTKLCWQRQQCHPTHKQWAWCSTSPQCLSSKGSLGWWAASQESTQRDAVPVRLLAQTLQAGI